VRHEVTRAARILLAVPLALGLVHIGAQMGAAAQDRLKAMPGYEQFQKMRGEIPQAVRTGAVTAVTWQGPETFEYTHGDQRFRYDVVSKAATETAAPPQAAGGGRGGRGGSGIERGRQAASADSPDGTLRAFYRDRNLWMSTADGGEERAVTTDGSEADRIKYGTASWVYGEELNQTTAMWWSPDSTKLAYYRFDEKDVQDYYLQLDQTEIQSRVDVEAYPKAGTPNPVVDLFVYDVPSGKTTKVDVRSGQPFDNAAVGHYVYRIAWSPDGSELLFNRTNRRQQILEFVAANPSTGETRVILREEWPTGWVRNSPPIHWLSDGKRFIWESERTGWANLYLYDISGKLITPLTTHDRFETAGLTKVDEQAGVIFYQARSGDNHMKVQLHRVGFDGTGDVRLTDPAFHHTVGGCLGGAGGGGRGGGAAGGANTCGISPDNTYFVDVYQAHNRPPATRLVDATTGKPIAEIAASDLSRYKELGFRPAEMFTYKAADGETTLYGMIQFPSNFDPSKQYPALASVYGGPGSTATRETFATPHSLAEYGFLILSLDSRSSPGRGKRTLDASYLKLGVTEMEDMALGVRALWDRPYFDRQRVGIYGTSYGGYAAVLSLLRYPDVYQAASASSPVSSWYHYDTIYTERYMWIPQENKEGYEAGNAMNYTKDLQGRLMLYYGTADNNVHPSNMMQLIKALQDAGKSFEVQIGPDRGHTAINQDRMMEFFIENLVVRPVAAATQTY
jgi:dipeptidyl-peptidase 4